MPDSKLTDLFKKYLEESITPEEFSQLYEKIRAGYDPEDLDKLLEATFSNPAFSAPAADYNKKEVFASLLTKIEEKESTSTRVIPIYRRLRITGTAAAITILLAGGIYWISHKQKVSSPLVIEKKEIRFDAPPGKSGAILTLANGQEVELDSTQNGALTQQGNTRLSKQGGKLSYHTEGLTSGNASLSHDPAVIYNIITTPRGRQFELVLADGTRVSLNAASSIRFPASFTGKERRVEVSGEAYFEVAKNASMPFIVTLPSSEVQVLGTNFNVSAYNDENNINATLLEGSIKFSSGAQEVLLTPGDQGKIDRGTSVLSHKKVDVDEVIAWTKGRLAINNSDLSVLMRQISRWYDVDVVFQGNIPNVRIGGFLHRDVNLSTVLDFLAENGVHFKAEGKTITILP